MTSNNILLRMCYELLPSYVHSGIHIMEAFNLMFFVCLFFETGFVCVALEPVLELALVNQAALELTETRLSLPPECWD